jgi:hypothetical protein
MGQPLSRTQQEFLRRLAAVEYVTPEHIGLNTGAVVDPSEFVPGAPRRFLVRKLLECGCTPWKLHKAGLHVVVEITAQVTVLGNIIGPIDHLHPCKKGRWATEETLTEEQARTCGLLRAPWGAAP